MKVLAVDTSTPILSVSLSQDNQLMADYQLYSQQHGATLTQVVQQLLAQLNWQPNQIDELVIGIGPGSYTGLRIGITFAKMWAEFSEAQLRQVSSLALIASGALGGGLAKDSWVVPLMDARRQTAYTGVYRWTGEQLEQVIADQQSDWLSFVETHLLQAAAPVVLVGHEVDHLLELIPESFDYQMINSCPQTNRWQQLPTQLVTEPELLVPNYLQATLAEREWAQAHQQSIAKEQDNASFIDYTY